MVCSEELTTDDVLVAKTATGNKLLLEVMEGGRTFREQIKASAPVLIIACVNFINSPIVSRVHRACTEAYRAFRDKDTGEVYRDHSRRCESRTNLKCAILGKHLECKYFRVAQEADTDNQCASDHQRYALPPRNRFRDQSRDSAHRSVID